MIYSPHTVRGRGQIKTVGRSGAIALTCIGAVAATTTGCGDARNTDQGFRPPITHIVALLLDGKTARISPASVGGGPITLKITNHGNFVVRKVSLRSRDGLPGCVTSEAVAGPILVGGTGTLTATLAEGTCEVLADKLASEQLTVTAERASAQNDLLLP